MDSLTSSDWKVKKKIDFLSTITELPITRLEHTIRKGLRGKEWASKTRFRLGQDYIFRINCSVEDRDSLNCSRRFSYKGKILSQSDSNIGPYDLSTEHDIKQTITKLVLTELGGVNTEIPFMNFERYSFDSLREPQDFNREDDMTYFSNMYLLLMTHQKELGIQMPPILGDEDGISDARNKGNVPALQSLIDQRLAVIRENYRRGCVVHSEEEARQILESGRERQMHFDQTVPLIEKFSGKRFIRIKGPQSEKQYNILVVEDFGDHLTTFGTAGILAKKVSILLEKENGFGGSYVIPEVNLPACMELCSTGQIDAVIFDGANGNGLEGSMYFGLENEDIDVGDNKSSIDLSGAYSSISE